MIDVFIGVQHEERDFKSVLSLELKSDQYTSTTQKKKQSRATLITRVLTSLSSESIDTGGGRVY